MMKNAGTKRAGCLMLCLLMLLSLTLSAHAEEMTYADTIRWDAQYDVVVVGFGGAGGVSAITAADEGAQVLILEKRPKAMKAATPAMPVSLSQPLQKSSSLLPRRISVRCAMALIL